MGQGADVASPVGVRYHIFAPPITAGDGAGSWSELPAFGLPAPDCMAAPWTMVNSYNGIEVEADGRPTLDIYVRQR